MLKVKHFTQRTTFTDDGRIFDNYNLEDDLNDFLANENIEIVDIKYSGSQGSLLNEGYPEISHSYSALVIYKEL